MITVSARDWPEQGCAIVATFISRYGDWCLVLIGTGMLGSICCYSLPIHSVIKKLFLE